MGTLFEYRTFLTIKQTFFRFSGHPSKTGHVWTSWIPDLSGIQMVTVYPSLHYRPTRICFSCMHVSYQSQNKKLLQNFCWALCPILCLCKWNMIEICDLRHFCLKYITCLHLELFRFLFLNRKMSKTYRNKSRILTTNIFIK